MGKLISRILIHVSRAQKRQLWVVLLIVVTSALLESVTIASVLPLLTVLTQPEALNDTAIGVFTLKYLDNSNPTDFRRTIVFAFILLILASSVVRVCSIWLSSKAAFSIGTELSTKVYINTLHRNFIKHKLENSSESIARMATKMNTVVLAIIFPAVSLCAAVLLIVIILPIYIYLLPGMGIVAFILVVLGYVGVSGTFKSQLDINSEQTAKNQSKQVKLIEESLGGIRDIIINSSHRYFTDKYSQLDKKLRMFQAKTVIVAQSPRYAIEAIGIIAIICIAYFVSGEEGAQTAQIFPILGVMVMGVQRMLPIAQQFYRSWASIRGNRAACEEILDVLEENTDLEKSETQGTIHFEHKIELENVCYQYPDSADWVLKDISFKILAGQRVGIVGATGSGKSTLIDIIMGLISPSCGKITIDNSELDISKLKAWRKQVAHVPQSIYLADASFTENIAFGIRKDDILKERVEYAAKQAQITDVIRSRAEGYECRVGERGDWLSGGQRQRVGLARATYKDARLMVLDEATSALDDQTESAVMDTIYKMDKSKTVIIISHKIDTLIKCDFIIKLENGRIAGIGPYHALV